MHFKNLQHSQILTFIIKLLEQAEDWFLDPTHKTCRSFVDGSDYYLATIVVYNAATNKGFPTALFITSKECTPVLVKCLHG